MWIIYCFFFSVAAKSHSVHSIFHFCNVHCCQTSSWMIVEADSKERIMVANGGEVFAKKSMR